MLIYARKSEAVRCSNDSNGQQSVAEAKGAGAPRNAMEIIHDNNFAHEQACAGYKQKYDLAC